ncbi:MAG: SDR family oxidoreductase [Chloroflexi bacterium]|nr:SDR family oxidoreductase [Chloroflexota bacterium]MDA1219522.1 SDR family oxidoreductase [Chloroflexota bacterium]
MSSVLVIGGSGFIGQYLVRHLLERQEHQVSGTYNSRMVQGEDCNWYRADLTDERELGEVFETVNPEIVVLLAAMADVGRCERDSHLATKVNLIGTENVTTLCNNYQTKLVYLSTEYVFDGERGNYREDETPAPTTHYGQTKWEAEQAVSRCTSPWSVIRTSLVYGWPSWANQPNLVTRLIDNLTEGRHAYGHTDQYRSPVYVEDLVQGIVRVMGEDYSGVYHLAGPDWAHMGQFVKEVAETFQLDSSRVIQEESSAPGAGGSRPSLLGLDSTLSIKRLGFQPRDIGSGLQDMRTNRRESP